MSFSIVFFDMFTTIHHKMFYCTLSARRNIVLLQVLITDSCSMGTWFNQRAKHFEPQYLNCVIDQNQLKQFFFVKGGLVYIDLFLSNKCFWFEVAFLSFLAPSGALYITMRQSWSIPDQCSSGQLMQCMWHTQQLCATISIIKWRSIPTSSDVLVTLLAILRRYVQIWKKWSR